MLLWSVLHLTATQAVDADYERLGHPSVSLDDIRHFRQLDSRAPGHPEYRSVSGVETTTGPLGQGVATSVGMAIAQKWLAHRYNRPGFEIFDYDIYAVCGDGCLMSRAERARAEHPLAPRGLGGSRPVEQDHLDVRVRGKLPGRQPGWEEPAFRYPRAPHGGDRERTLAVQAPRLRRDVLHLQRLRPAGHPPVRPDGAPHSLRLHARRHGRRRGRSDPPAGGTSGIPA
jgi:Transketolase, thiamine diphosphate binding domain